MRQRLMFSNTVLGSHLLNVFNGQNIRGVKNTGLQLIEFEEKCFPLRCFSWRSCSYHFVVSGSKPGCSPAASAFLSLVVNWRERKTRDNAPDGLVREAVTTHPIRKQRDRRMIELRRRTFWQRLACLWPPVRRRQDLALEVAIECLMDDPSLPCMIEGWLVIPSPPQEDKWQ